MRISTSKHLIVFIGIASAFIGLVICLFIFQPKPLQPVKLSFYNWQNQFELDSNECQFIDQHGVDHLRVKLFELSLNASTHSAVVNNHIDTRSYDKGCEDFFLTHTVTPVVFIDNDIFYKIDSANIREMAGLVKRAMIIHSVDLLQPDRYQWNDRWYKLYFSLEMPEAKTDSLNDTYQLFKKNIVSYEFDCDWTEQTKNNYFYFLQQVKDSLNKPIEATLRLHQYKYREKTGIPPVDGVNLMCYNMGEFNQKKETNSIFNIELLKQYIEGQKAYPLPMNIALPTFSWVVAFRNNKFLKLIPYNSIQYRLENSSYTIEKIDATHYSITDEFYYDWSVEPLRKGDYLRIEKIETQTLLKGYALLRKELANTPKEVILFDLNNTKKIEDFDELAKYINRK